MNNEENEKIVQLLEQLNDNLKSIARSAKSVQEIQFCLAVYRVDPTSQLSRDLTAALLQGAKEWCESIG